jgi:hypothetical protein
MAAQISKKRKVCYAWLSPCWIADSGYISPCFPAAAAAAIPPIQRPYPLAAASMRSLCTCFQRTEPYLTVLVGVTGIA